MLIFYCFIKDILERNWLLFLFFFFLKITMTGLVLLP